MAYKSSSTAAVLLDFRSWADDTVSMNTDGAVLDAMDEAETVKVRLPPEQPRNIMDQAFWSLGLPAYVMEQQASWQLELEQHIAKCDSGCHWCDYAGM